jgi:hypothetical protein
MTVNDPLPVGNIPSDRFTEPFSRRSLGGDRPAPFEHCDGIQGSVPDEVDWVNEPPHYRSHASGIECIDVVEHMTFNVGNTVKYCWRAGLKGDIIEDLKKAAWYLEHEIQRLEKLKGK